MDYIAALFKPTNIDLLTHKILQADSLENLQAQLDIYPIGGTWIISKKNGYAYKPLIFINTQDGKKKIISLTDDSDSYSN